MGLCPSMLEIISDFTPLAVLGQAVVWPVIALIKPGAQLNLSVNPDEVEQVFFMPASM